MLMFRIACLSLVAVSVVACGSTSNLSAVNANPATATVGAAKEQPVSFSQYNRVVVKEFGYKADADSDTVQIGSSRFAEYIAANLRSNSAFREVILQRVDSPVASLTPETLVVDGDITRYNEGNPALRALVGMGAGSAYFDATVNVRDGTSGKVLAQSKVDLNSWALGGFLAASQSVDTFMMDASRKVATDLVNARNGKVEPAAGTEQVAETK